MKRIRAADHACESDASMWGIETSMHMLPGPPRSIRVSRSDADLAKRLRDGIAKARAALDIIEALPVIVDDSIEEDAWVVCGDDAEVYWEGA